MVSLRCGGAVRCKRWVHDERVLPAMRRRCRFEQPGVGARWACCNVKALPCGAIDRKSGGWPRAVGTSVRVAVCLHQS